MEIRDDASIMQATEEFVERLLTLQMQIAELQLDVKEIKKDYKMEGVNVSAATRVVNEMKKNLKKKDTDKTEEELLFEKLNTNDKINSMIHDIVTM